MKKQRKLIASEIWSTLQVDFGTSDWYWLGLDVISKVTSTAFFYCILLLSESHQDLFMIQHEG